MTPEEALNKAEHHARQARRSMWWCWFWAAVALAALVGVLIGNSTAEGGGYLVCHPSRAHSTRVMYVVTGQNTSVVLIAHCYDATTAWYISYFDGLVEDGSQPELWDWREIQDTASRLLHNEMTAAEVARSLEGGAAMAEKIGGLR